LGPCAAGIRAGISRLLAKTREGVIQQKMNKRFRQIFGCSPVNSEYGRESRKRIGLIAVISAILAVVVIGSMVYSSGLFREGPVMLVISTKGEDIVAKPLNEIPDGTIFVEGVLGTTTVEIKQGNVHVLSSPCENHICMNTGWISNPGQIIVCLPNEVVVRLIKN
jgi:hypothetical protein